MELIATAYSLFFILVLLCEAKWNMHGGKSSCNIYVLNYAINLHMIWLDNDAALFVYN